MVFSRLQYFFNEALHPKANLIIDNRNLICCIDFVITLSCKDNCMKDENRELAYSNRSDKRLTSPYFILEKLNFYIISKPELGL